MDAYQQAVEYLTANPNLIPRAWLHGGYLHADNNITIRSMAGPGAILFQVTGGKDCGCLTIVRGDNEYPAATKELTSAIRSDRRIPCDDYDITVDHLPIFASWQRHIDRVLHRTPPSVDDRIPAAATYARDLPLPGISLEIPMTQGMSALIDAADEPLVSAMSWSARKGKNGTWYARGYRRLANRQKQWVYMHRLIAEASRGQMIDHRNHDGTDNRRHNLRICNGSQNNMNRREGRSTSQFRGVSLAANGKWLAQIMKDRHQNYLGQFNNETEAARAYNAKAVELFGDFARLNDLPVAVS